MQEDYASNRRLNMMHVDHAMPIWGGNKHRCLIRWLTLDTQNRCSGGEPLLDWVLYLILITFNAVYRSFEMNVSLCLIFIGALMFVWDKVQNCCFVCLLYSLVWDWLVAAFLLCYIEPLLHWDISLQTCAGLFFYIAVTLRCVPKQYFRKSPLNQSRFLCADFSAAIEVIEAFFGALDLRVR